MDYILEGIGNELLTILISYFIVFLVLLRFLKCDQIIITQHRLSSVWQYFRQLFTNDDVVGVGVVTSGTDPSLDVHIFNSDCCVCLSEDCNYPVTSGCGHCFCGTCAMNLIEHNSVPMKCPLCRQECQILYLPFKDSQTVDSHNELRDCVVNSVTSYNTRAENRFPFVNRVRNAPVMLRHLMRSFLAFHSQLIFRLKCHVVAAVLVAGWYLALSTDIIPEQVFGLIGFIDDIIVLTFLTVLVLRTYTSLDSSVTLDDIRAALE